VRKLFDVFVFMFKAYAILAVVSIFLYGLGAVLAEGAHLFCRGFNCDEIICWDNYAIKTPHGYIPCEELDDYLDQLEQEGL